MHPTSKTILVGLCLFVLNASPQLKLVSGGSLTGPSAAQAITPLRDKVGPVLRKGSQLPAIDVQPEVLRLVREKKDGEAIRLLKSSIEQTTDRQNLYDWHYLLSALCYQDGDYKQAAASLRYVLKELPGAKADDSRQHFFILKRLGDCYYGDRDLEPALANYQAALALADRLGPGEQATIVLYESLVGTLEMGKRLPEAEAMAKKLLEMSKERAKSGRVDDRGALFWAYLQLGNIYRLQHKETERLQLREDGIKLLNEVLNLRTQLAEIGQLPSLEDIRRAFLMDYIKVHQPASLADYIWLASEFRFRSLPVIEWPAKGGSAQAAMLCIHGLGLDNRAFGHFGEAMSRRGFTVYALDIRGFGAWLSVPGQEDVDFGQAIRDIAGIVEIIKSRHPDLPVFLVGESMGGALALRAAAEKVPSISGVISSVPSAERFQGRRMSVTVALHFLDDPDKPFNIGQMVTEKATSRADLQKSWETDIKAKMKMTPIELAKFAAFMRTTEFRCKKISDLPIFIVQGLKDRLVKPGGTFNMFEAVESADKTLLIVGTAEHLIFETDQQSKILLDTLESWLKEHIGSGTKNVGQVTNAK